MISVTILLIVAGFFGAIINAIAGGGAILMLPALLAAGLAPINASATISLAVLPGAVTAVLGYRSELKSVPKYFLWLIVPCLIGSAYGAYILTRTDPETFEQIIPWLVLVAVLMLALQAQIHRSIVDARKLVKTKINLALPILFLAVFVLAIYGGFFGVGFGLMMLALLGISKLKNSYQLSAIKNLCGISITAVAAIYFLKHGLLDVHHGLLLAVGTAAGGYCGAKLSKKVSSHMLHWFTVGLGIILTIYLFVK